MNSKFSIGWKNEHEGDSFPFSDLLESDQGVELPSQMIVDAQISTLGPGRIRLKKIAISSRSVFVVFVAPAIYGSGKELIGEVMISEMDSGYCDVYDENGISFGILSFGEKASTITKKTISKIYTFNKKRIFLHSSCTVSLNSGVITSIGALNVVARGSVTLNEGTGVEIEKTTSNNKNTIAIHAVGDSMDPCCPDDYDPLVFINGVGHNGVGNITMRVSDTNEPLNKESPRQALKVEAIQGGLKISIV
jgi:hypothetical protein